VVVIPILVTCKDRLRYLDITLKSLSASLPPKINVYVSDDGSTNPNMHRYLTTNDNIPLNNSYMFPNNNTEWIKKIGFIPNLKQIIGIKGKVNVFLRSKSCGIKNFTYAVRKLFLIHQCDYVIKIQDDVIFKHGWYEFMCGILTHYEPSMVSGFRYFLGKNKPDLINVGHGVQQLGKINTGGLLMAISRKACTINDVLWFNNDKRCIDMDDFWSNNCRKTKLPLLVTNPGLCQHIGFDSSIYKKNNKRHMFESFRSRADMDMVPPYAIDNSVAKMCDESIVINLDKIF
jgi:glycosyltransferase involved in cell wall biosynthesis